MKTDIHELILMANEVYSALADEESRVVFRNKLMYEISKSNEKNIYLHKIWKYKDPDRYLKLENSLKTEKEIVVYGVGDYCASVIECCNWLGGKVSYLCDTDKSKYGTKGPYGLEIISPEQLFKEHLDAYVVISTLRAHREVYEYLKSNIDEEKIIEFAIDIEEEMVSEQYFDPFIMKYEDEEVFVDCGCYDFGTSVFLSEKCNVKKVYAFEPDPQNIPKIQEGIKKTNIKDVEIFEKGVWDRDDTLHFCCNGSTTSYAVESADEATIDLDVVALDNMIDNPVSFIKMDIEGSELKALQGAKKIIQQYKPKLTISVYHKPEDIIEIPLYIKNLVPEYKLYLRHYSNFYRETIVYALPY